MNVRQFNYLVDIALATTRQFGCRIMCACSWSAAPADIQIHVLIHTATLPTYKVPFQLPL